MIRTLLAFLRKDALSVRDYRFTLFVNLSSAVFGVVTFFFLGRLVRPHSELPFNLSTNGYFPYVMVGLAVATLLISTMNGLANNLRRELHLGTFDLLLASPTSEETLLMGVNAWNVCLASFTSLIYLASGLILISHCPPVSSLLLAFLVVGIAATFFLALGAVAALVILFYRRTHPVVWVISSLFVLLGGVYFPVHLLPFPVDTFSAYLPVTLTTETLRSLLLADAQPPQVYGQMSVLLAYSISCVIFSRIIIKLIFRRLRTGRLLVLD